jgi:hypothetical protein
MSSENEVLTTKTIVFQKRNEELMNKIRMGSTTPMSATGGIIRMRKRSEEIIDKLKGRPATIKPDDVSRRPSITESEKGSASGKSEVEVRIRQLQGKVSNIAARRTSINKTPDSLVESPTVGTGSVFDDADSESLNSDRPRQNATHKNSVCIHDQLLSELEKVFTAAQEGQQIGRPETMLASEDSNLSIFEALKRFEGNSDTLPMPMKRERRQTMCTKVLVGNTVRMIEERALATSETAVKARLTKR